MTKEPWAVINTAGYVNVDRAESDREQCFRENALGPEVLARACTRKKIPFLTFSSDFVFNGEKGKKYLETDEVAPVNIYGLSKVEAERRVLDTHANSLVVRTSSFFGPWDSANFVTMSLKRLAAGENISTLSDITMSPT